MPSGGGDKLGDAATWRYYWRPSDVKRLVAHLAANPSPNPSPSPNSNSNPSPNPSPNPIPNPNPDPNPNQVAHLAGRHPAEAALKRELQLRLPWWEAAQAYAEGQGGGEGGAEGAEGGGEDGEGGGEGGGGDGGAEVEDEWQSQGHRLVGRWVVRVFEGVSVLGRL